MRMMNAYEANNKILLFLYATMREGENQNPPLELILNGAEHVFI